jgi:exonuclease VII small subunit
MADKNSSFWEERLKNFEDKSSALKEKVKQLEEEIKGLEGSIYRKNITSYRTSILDRAKKTFINTFRQRDELPPEEEVKEEWERLTSLMSACITVLKAIDTEEASVCGSSEELKNYLKNEAEAKTDLPESEIASLLEN